MVDVLLVRRKLFVVRRIEISPILVKIQPEVATTHHRIVVSGHQAAVRPPAHIANETKMLTKASERL